MHDVPNKGTIKHEIMPHLFAAKRGYDSKKRLGGCYSVASPQADGCLSAANYFCPPMMLLPLSVSSMPCNRSRWPPQAYVSSLLLPTRAGLQQAYFVWFLVRNLTQ